MGSVLGPTSTDNYSLISVERTVSRNDCLSWCGRSRITRNRSYCRHFSMEMGMNMAFTTRQALI